MFKTYKIIFTMSAPLCFIERPNFDTILIYCYMREKYGNKGVNLKGQVDSGSFPDLPIEYHPDGFPLASVMFLDTSAEYIGSWKKRWDNKNDDLADFGKQQRKIEVGKKAFKSFDMPLSLHHARNVWFYFCSANVQRVQQLILTQLAGIGKKVSQGYGFYEKFEIEESDISFEENVLRPHKIGLDSTIKVMNGAYSKGDAFPFIKRYCAWRPSYTDTDNFAECIYPNLRQNERY